jgi:chromatin segregation and condensation protein Rec8/ScpA/Scc1 (kleisin family)
LVTALKVSIPTTVDVTELEEEIVTALGERLRDDHGYKLAEAQTAAVTERANTYPLQPGGSIVVDKDDDAITVKLRVASDVDAADLFTAISSTLQQRHDGLRTEIG